MEDVGLDMRAKSDKKWVLFPDTESEVVVIGIGGRLRKQLSLSLLIPCFVVVKPFLH